MKRLVTVFLLLTVTAIIPTPPLFAQNPAAVITEISGTVELKISAAAAWVAAKTGDRINTETIISTGFKSTALIAIGDSIITVRPLTRLSMEELIRQNNEETINVKLRTGRVKVDVKPPAGGKTNFSVQSPSSTASVRGTAFNMNTTSITVTEGTVNFASSNYASQAVTVSAGESSMIDPDTGKALTPMKTAETAFALPLLPGETEGTGTGTRIRSQSSTGNLELEIEIKLR
jgi:hypothetical protein